MILGIKTTTMHTRDTYVYHMLNVFVKASKGCVVSVASTLTSEAKEQSKPYMYF